MDMHVELIRQLMHNRKYAAVTEFAKINNNDRNERIFVSEYMGNEPRLMIRGNDIHILCPKEMTVVQEAGIADSIANGTIFDDASLLNDQADYMQKTILPMNAILNKHGIEPKKIRVMITGVVGRINDDGNLEISFGDIENGKNFLHDITSGRGCEHVNKMCDHYLGLKNDTDKMEGHCSLPLDIRRDIYDLTKEIDSITDVSPEDEVTDEDFDPLGTKYNMEEIETLHEASEPMKESEDDEEVDEAEDETVDDEESSDDEEHDTDESESMDESEEEESDTEDESNDEEIPEADEEDEEDEDENEEDDSALDNESEEEDKKKKKSKDEDEVEDEEIEEEEPEEDIDEEDDKPKKRSNKKKKDDEEEEEEEIDEEEIEEMYYDESFRDRHPKRLKPIPRDIISYITIEMNAIKDSNDQAMIAGYCSAKLELVDFYLNCIDTQDSRYIVPHNKQYLLQMQTELNDLLKRILQIKPINKYDRIWGGIL
jgi:hypothetical protein